MRVHEEELYKIKKTLSDTLMQVNKLQILLSEASKPAQALALTKNNIKDALDHLQHKQGGTWSYEELYGLLGFDEEFR